MSEPKTVGVRELRQNLSVYLRDVEAGSSYEVTARGRRVALLSPLREHASTWGRLLAEGKITPARGSTSALPPPVRAEGARPTSELLEEIREDRA